MAVDTQSNWRHTVVLSKENLATVQQLPWYDVGNEKLPITDSTPYIFHIVNRIAFVTFKPNPVDHDDRSYL
jgi:hypothetical protein